MKKINLSGRVGEGAYTTVDDDIYDKYSHLTWHWSNGYAVRRDRVEDGWMRLHRVVAETPEGLHTDHLNGDRLDNRRSNLRVCTNKENSMNRKNTRGYTKDKSRDNWIVTYRGKYYGRYSTEDEAKRAYQLACSGVPYRKKQRKQYMLPKNIHKQFGKYNISLQRNGVRRRKNGISTLAEAIEQLNEWKKEG
jgi:hypothetical protein